MSYQYVITSDCPMTNLGHGKFEFERGNISVQELGSHGPLKDENLIMKIVEHWSFNRGDEYFELKVKKTIIEAIVKSARTVLEAIE